jgi:hypothetical protein
VHPIVGAVGLATRPGDTIYRTRSADGRLHRLCIAEKDT